MSDFLSNRFKSERKKLNLSQEALGRLLDVSESTVKRWEAGAAIPSDKLILCSEHGFDLDHLFGKENRSKIATQYNNSDEFAFIPVVDVAVSAGNGAINHTEKVLYHFAYRKDWLKSRRLFESKLYVIVVRGDSMEPTISDNECILINTADNVPQDGHIYVIRNEEKVWVKRIQTLIDDSLLLLSDNQQYPAMRLDLQNTPDVQIIGKVVNSSKNFY